MDMKIKNGLKILALFLALFLINILVFNLLSLLGFTLVLTTSSYLFPPLVATIFCTTVAYANTQKKKENKDE